MHRGHLTRAHAEGEGALPPKLDLDAPALDRDARPALRR
jgi:hypothetical protein